MMKSGLTAHHGEVLRLSRVAGEVESPPHPAPITVFVSALLANFFSGIGLPNR